MRTSIIAVLLAAFVLFEPGECASKSKPRPRWVTNLRTQGYGDDKFAPPGAYASIRQIVFGSNGELVVVDDANTSWAAPGHVFGFVLDTRSGKTVNKITWRAKGHAYIYSTEFGHYGVNTATGLALYSAGLATIEVTVPYSAKLASPDGISFAAWKRIPGPHGVTYFLDPHTLKPTGVEYLDKSINTICQDRIAYTGSRKGTHFVRVLGPSGTVFTYRTQCSEIRPHFISKNVLAVLGCDRVEVIDTSDGLLFSQDTEEDLAMFSGASRDGNRFVIVEDVYGRGHDPKLRFERFTVIDLAARTSVLIVETKKLRGRRSGGSGGALSPDGTMLAVHSLGIVQLFDIPESSKGNE